MKQFMLFCAAARIPLIAVRPPVPGAGLSLIGLVSGLMRM